VSLAGHGFNAVPEERVVNALSFDVLPSSVATVFHPPADRAGTLLSPEARDARPYVCTTTRDVRVAQVRSRGGTSMDT
jgi:hypothetical protein